MTDLNYLTLEKLKTISLTELLKLKQNLDNAIEVLPKNKKEELITQLFKEAKENGISLDEFEGLMPETKTILQPKYKDPDSNKTFGVVMEKIQNGLKNGKKQERT
jgi:hypothetical protein